MSAQVLEHTNGLIGTHVDATEGIWMVRADRQERDLWRAVFANLFESIEIGAVSRMVNPPSLMFQQEATVAPVMISKRARPPVFAGREGHFPITVREALPPFQFDHAGKAQIVSQIADPPGHDPNLWMRQPAQRG